jgi:hypothetical protein
MAGQVFGNSLAITANGTAIGGYTNGSANISGNITTGGNIFVAGRISAVGNITGSNIVTSGNITGGSLFLPESGKVSAGNILSAGPITAVTISAAGNITGANLLTTGSITATGNIQGNYFVGNGSQLTGLTSQLSGNMIGNINANTYSIQGASLLSGANLVVTTANILGNIKAGGFLNANGSPYQSPGGPAFIATGTNQSIPASPSTVSVLPLIFTGVSQNINNGYNASTGIFTAPVAGFYQVSATMGVNPPYVPPPPAAGALILLQNSTAIEAGPYITAITVGGTTVISASSVSRLVYLNVGGTLQCALAYIGGAGWSTYTNLIPGSFQACWLRS